MMKEIKCCIPVVIKCSDAVDWAIEKASSLQKTAAGRFEKELTTAKLK